jgi:large repetitive protein
VLIEPLSINLPDMQSGEEYTGELSITNYGLVRADDVVFTPAPTDQYFKFEFLGSVPSQLAAQTRISLPFKVTALQPLPLTQADLAKARVIRIAQPRPVVPKAGSCTSYSSPLSIKYDYTCANGDTRGGSSGSGFHKFVGASCGSTGGGGGGGGGGPAGGFGGGGGGSPAPIPMTPACTPDCPTCGPGSGPGGGPPGAPSNGPSSPTPAVPQSGG